MARTNNRTLGDAVAELGDVLAERHRLTKDYNWLCRCGRVAQPEWRFCPDCGCSRVAARHVVDVTIDRLAADLAKTKPCPGCGDEIPADATRCTKCDLVPSAAAERMTSDDLG